MFMVLSSRLRVEKGRCIQIRDIFEDRIGKKFEGKEEIVVDVQVLVWVS